MQKVVLNIKDPNRAHFLLELLQGLDYVEIEKEESELSEEHKRILDERLANHEANPNEGSPWQEVKQRIANRH